MASISEIIPSVSYAVQTETNALYGHERKCVYEKVDNNTRYKLIEMVSVCTRERQNFTSICLSILYTNIITTIVTTEIYIAEESCRTTQYKLQHRKDYSANVQKGKADFKEAQAHSGDKKDITS